MAVTGIQETKWFGQDVWNVSEYTLLHLGHTLPDDGEPLIRNEGVDIVLDQRATAVWKNAGECWEVVISRIVTVRLQIAQQEQRQCSGSRWTSSRYLSLYGPTTKAPLGVKAGFIDDLQSTWDSLPAGDIVLVLGDFNAHVGKRESGDDVWREVRGPHGIGTYNEAGEQILELCAVNYLTIMNTWFKKEAVHL